MKNFYDWWMVIESYEVKVLSVIGVLWFRLIFLYILYIRSCVCCRSSNGCIFMLIFIILYLFFFRFKMFG